MVMIFIGCLKDAKGASLPRRQPFLALFRRFRVEAHWTGIARFDDLKWKHTVRSAMKAS
jgi:hypothetical protein